MDRAASRRTAWVLLITGAASLMVSLDVVVVTTALSTIQRRLGASVGQLEWTVNAYNLVFAILMMTAAVVSDRFGRRRTFMAGLAVFSAASAACALAPDVGWLIAARAVQGGGGAFVLPVALALLSASVPADRRGWALGVFAGVTGVALLFGPVVGGAITQGLSWQWIFWINVPIGLVVIPLAWRRLAESRGPRTAIDGVGLVAVSAGLLGIVWGLVRTDAVGWGSAETLGALLGGALLCVAFVRWELRAPAPMLPLRIFRERAFAFGNASLFMFAAGLVGGAFFVPQLLQRGLGHGPLAAGLGLVPWTAPLILVGPLAGRLVDRLGARPLAVAGALLQAAGLAALALVAHPGESYAEIVVPLVVAGTGPPMAYPALQAAVLGAVRPDEIGRASSAYFAARQVGAVFGVAVLVAVFAGAGSYASPSAFIDGFAYAAGVAAGLSVLSALAASRLPRRRAPCDRRGPRPVPVAEAGAA